jgi:hypothetical protein
LGKQKVGIAIADFHCGHRSGLTPSNYHYRVIESGTGTISEHKRDKFAKIQKEIWNWFKNEIKDIKRHYGGLDFALIGGDCIDGRGEKSGSTELITVDRDEQCDMAIEVIKTINAKSISIVYGTPYHSGTYEDLEDTIAAKVGAKSIGSQEFVEINGVLFDLKHHIGGSSVPYGRMTPVAKERLQNVLWNIHGEQPKADIIVRAHVHKYAYCGDSDWLAMTLPGMQAMGSKYGARRCSTTIDIGFVIFTISDKGEYTWKPKLARVQAQEAKIIKL